MNIANKVIWIAGASSGIGEALTYALAEQGAKLVLSARRIEELERVSANSKLPVANFLLLPIDLADQSNFEAKKDEVIKKFGRIDVLINNGGVSQRSLVKDTDLSTDKQLMNVNYFGTVGLTKVVLPHMLQQKDGMVVAITSAVGKFGSPWRSGYSASKHALHGFFDSMRAELHDDGIKVLLVCPGFVVTNVSYNALTGKGEKLGSMDAATAKGITAEDCAAQIVSAMKAEKEEIITSNFKEKFGVFMKRHFPGIFSSMIRRMAVR